MWSEHECTLNSYCSYSSRRNDDTSARLYYVGLSCQRKRRELWTVVFFSPTLSRLCIHHDFLQVNPIMCCDIESVEYIAISGIATLHRRLRRPGLV